MRYLLVISVLWAGCAMAVGQDAPLEPETLCEPGEEIPCCSWSDEYLGTCAPEGDRLLGCGWCLELDGQPGLGPWTW